MKKQFLTIIAFLLFVTAMFAQVPQGINYQTVVRNNAGAVIPNQNVAFRFSIVSGSPTGTPVYSESHSTTTNSLGLVNLVIGQGGSLPPSTPFSAINWASAPHYLTVDLDPTGGFNFQPMGTQQLMSVPYALSAGNSSTSMAQLTDVSVAGVADGQTLKWNAAQSKWLPANDIGGGAGDNWGTQTVQSDNTLTGNGTNSTPLKLAQQGATSGQVLKWNGSTWLPDNDIGGGTGDNWGTQTVQTDNTLTGNGTSTTPLKLAQQSATNGQVLKWNGTAWLPAADVNTDAQTLSINGNSLSISGGNSVTLPNGSSQSEVVVVNSGNFTSITPGEDKIFIIQGTITLTSNYNNFNNNKQFVFGGTISGTGTQTVSFGNNCVINGVTFNNVKIDASSNTQFIGCTFTNVTEIPSNVSITGSTISNCTLSTTFQIRFINNCNISNSTLPRVGYVTNCNISSSTFGSTSDLVIQMSNNSINSSTVYVSATFTGNNTDETRLFLKGALAPITVSGNNFRTSALSNFIEVDLGVSSRSMVNISGNNFAGGTTTPTSNYIRIYGSYTGTRCLVKISNNNAIGGSSAPFISSQYSGSADLIVNDNDILYTGGLGVSNGGFITVRNNVVH